MLDRVIERPQVPNKDNVQTHMLKVTIFCCDLTVVLKGREIRTKHSTLDSYIIQE